MKEKLKTVRIDAKNLHYRLLNERILEAIDKGYKKIILKNVCGQRYIGNGLEQKDVEIMINGVPGNDLASFMDGAKVIVNGNAQDGVGNTMNNGEVIVYGNAGDIVGYSMRGGRIFIRGNAGYRVGIHMKAYKEFYPVIVIGGTANDFFGEYMAGGLLVVLGLNQEKLKNRDIVGDFAGTGMHGGVIFLRGEIKKNRVGKGVKISKPTEDDMKLLKKHLSKFSEYFDIDLEKILNFPFMKLYPYTHRPYGKIYAY